MNISCKIGKSINLWGLQREKLNCCFMHVFKYQKMVMVADGKVAIRTREMKPL